MKIQVLTHVSLGIGVNPVNHFLNTKLVLILEMLTTLLV